MNRGNSVVGGGFTLTSRERKWNGFLFQTALSLLGLPRRGNKARKLTL